MPTGFQTVTVKSAQAGARDRKGIPSTTYVSSTWKRVSLQALTIKETVTNIDYLLDKYRIYGPADTVGLALKSNDLIVDSNNITYRVMGTKVMPLPNGLPGHVEAQLEVPSGLNTVPAP